jgi:hypothetical protein
MLLTVVTQKSFNFKNYKINTISLVKDGEQIPRRPIACDFNASKHFMSAYQTLINGTGINFLNEDIGITRDEYEKG